MRRVVLLLLLAASVPVVGCTRDDREWMKVGRSYTQNELRRDYQECSRKGDVDDACMRQRGWVPVNPTKEEAPPREMDPLQRGPRRY
jgi:hypothetical protein